VTSRSLVRLGFKALTTPEEANNEGHFEPLSVSLPSGSVVNPNPPASCALNWIHVGGVPDLMERVLEDELADEITASHFGTPCANFVYGVDPDDGTGYMLVEGDAGGWGAKPNSDGESALFCKELGDTRNTPVEVVESQYPLRVQQFSLIPDSGGPGTNRGGLGVRRDYTPIDHDAQITATFDRQDDPPWGIVDGRDAPKTNKTVVTRDTGETETYGKVTDFTINEEDMVSFQTGGGGGYGPPVERDPERVLADVRNGYVSKEHAREAYGVVITDEGELDHEATAERRS
jgi:N-methylhydantoinase B